MKRLGLLVATMFTLSGCGFEQVNEGYRGLKTVWGKVEGGPILPGLYFFNPISSTIFEMSVREEKIEETTPAFTKDTQTVHVTYAATYYPVAERIDELYSQFGLHWQQKIIKPAILGAIKDAIGQFNADDLIRKREEAKVSAFFQIEKSLEGRNIIVKKLDFINLDFEPEYEKAVERKVVAFQRAQEAKNRTVEVEEQAKQKVLQAKAEAESMRIRAQALTQNKSLVEYEAVQKWDGKLPQYQFGNSTPFINLQNASARRGK